MTNDSPRVIDTHAHLYPEAYLDRLEQIGIPAASTKIARNLGASDSEEEMDRRLAMMDRAGVALQVISAVPQLPMGDDAVAAGQAARMVNDIYARVLTDHPGRFIAYGALPLPHVEQSIEQIGYCLDELGFAGIGVTTIVQDDLSLADERLAPILGELDRRRALVYVHATGRGANCGLINDHHLEWVNGAPVEDAIAVLQLLKADVPGRFPGIRFHIAHLGGDLPFLAQRLEDNFEDWGSFPSSPTASLRQMWFDAANFHGPSLRLAMETLDPRRIMCGSDFPYFQDEKYTRAVDYIRRAGLEDAQVDAVLDGNARRLYGDQLRPPTTA